MDLFHAVTQGLDNILTCHWYEELKNFKMSGTNNNTKLMDTQAGGESTQYESIKTQTMPTRKEIGQLGGGSQMSSEQQPISKERGDKTAENIRYGQAISEQGFGGKTTTSSGQTQQGGYGGAEADKREEQPDAQSRRSQGYGPGSGVGA